MARERGLPSHVGGDNPHVSGGEVWSSSCEGFLMLPTTQRGANVNAKNEIGEVCGM